MALSPAGQPYEDAVWYLHCWTYDWDGKLFRRMCLKLEFEYFDGQKPITSLPYHPFELKEQDQRALIKGNLIKRGVEFRQFCTATQGSRMFEYNGEAMFVKKGFSGIQGDDDKVSLLVMTRSPAQGTQFRTRTVCHDRRSIQSQVVLRRDLQV